MKLRHVAIAVACLVAAPIMLAGANLVAGGLLFAMYKQDPRKATHDTMQQAFASDLDQKTKRKLILCCLVGVAVCVGGPIALVVAANSKRRQLHGSARLAHHGDVKAAGLFSPTGIFVGKYGGQFLRLAGQGFVKVSAPTRTGKGVSFVVPNLLTFDGSAVVQDIKEENYILTGAFRRDRLGQKVYYYNPLSAESHRSNPLYYISEDPNSRITDIQVLAATIYVEQPKEAPIWVESARNLFLGISLMVLETPEIPHTIGEILRQASGKGQQLPDYLAHVISVRQFLGTPLSVACVDSLRRFMSASDNTLKGVLATFLAPLSVWANPIVDKATSGNDFDLRDLRKTPATIYACAPARELATAKLLMNVFFSQLVGETLREQPQNNPQLKHQVLLMMDEFTAPGRIDILAKSVAFIASYNLRLAIVCQDDEQIVDVYGPQAAHNIAANMDTTIRFAPTQLRESKDLSELIGYVTERTRSQQYSNNASASGGSTGRTLTVSEQRRALMMPQEVRELDSTKEFVVRSGMPVLMASKAEYFNDPVLKKLFESVPTITTLVNGQARVIPVPLALPPANWDAFYESLRTSDLYFPDSTGSSTGTGNPDHADDTGELDDDQPAEVDESVLLARINSGQPVDPVDMSNLVARRVATFLTVVQGTNADIYESSAAT